MAKKNMKRYAPGDGMTKQKDCGCKSEQSVPELQGKQKESKSKAKPQ